MNKAHVICTVTNDLHQDQRMHRICTALVEMGYRVTLVGRLRPTSSQLPDRPYQQHRLAVRWQSGPGFYYSYTLALKAYLLDRKPTVIYAVDTDTLVAAGSAKRRLGCKLVVDMHEYFTEVPELHGRRIKKAIWRYIEQRYMPLADACITVGPALAGVFSELYRKHFHVVRNVPKLTHSPQSDHTLRILYQGVLNAGRGLAEAIDAMGHLSDSRLELHIVGGGDIEDELRIQAQSKPYADRVVFHGWKYGEELRTLTQTAWLGLNLLEVESRSYYYSLANKFFDYMHAGVPSLNMDIPEYAAIVREYEISLLLAELSPQAIANAINTLRADDRRYQAMVSATDRAAQVYHWDTEKQTLQTIMDQLMDSEM